jgi:DNA-binding LacI/PurR family transcriptional regulator
MLDLDRNRSTPVYRQIEDQLREKILQGDLPAGACLPNGQELSKRFGVAYRTVIRSLNTLKKQGLLKGVPSRGTFVQEAPSRRVQNIAITFDRGYQQDILRDVERFQRGVTAACDERFHLQLFPLRDATIFSTSEPTLLSRLVEDWHIHGVITYSAPPAEDIDRLVQLKVPVVTSRDIYVDPENRVPWAMEDVADGARQLVRFITALGHRRVGLVMGPRPGIDPKVIRPSGLLAERLLAELASAQTPCAEDRIVYSDFRWPSVRETVQGWLASAQRPTALIFADDQMALAGIKLAESMGLSVPRDLSVASYGDFLPLGSALTTIHLPMEQIARRAVNYLDQLMSGQTPRPELVGVELRIRQTCAQAMREPKPEGST